MVGDVQVDEAEQAPTARSRWAHVSYFVGSPSNASFLELDNPRASMEDPNVLRLDVKQLVNEEYACDAVYSACEFVADFGVQLPCCVTMYRLVATNEHRMLTGMYVADVEVVKYMDHVVEWAGHDQEHRRRRKRASGGGARDMQGSGDYIGGQEDISGQGGNVEGPLDEDDEQMHESGGGFCRRV